MFDLTDRVVVVTGGSGNLGRAVAAELARAGAVLVMLDRSSAASVPDPSRALAVGGLDLTDAGAIAAALDEAQARFGRLDGLVATIGAFAGGTPVRDERWQTWNMMLEANLRTTLAACQAIIPRLGPGGRIVTIGARPGLSGSAGTAAYAASKAAVLRLTESLSDELKDQGVTVNCVLPSIMDTPQNRAAMPNADASRWVPLEDVARPIVFLLSDAARSVTGALIPVYGRS